MNERIKNLDTPKKCEIFAKNALNAGREDLVKQAKERAIHLKAENYGAETSAEKEAIKAVYAYEEVLSAKNGKKTRASRTWPMIQKYGIINGIVISVIYMIILYLASSFVNNDFSINSKTIYMLITGSVLGILGGIIGVNIKHQR